MQNPPLTVLISGVSTGIGRAAATYFLRRGWWVYGSVRTAGDAGELHDEPGFTELVFDVTDPNARRAAVAQIEADGAALSILVNNAGIAVSGPLEVLPEADYRRQFEVNVFGALGLTQDCLPLLHATRERHPGRPVRIINVTSVSGVITSPFTSIYSASKFALESLTDGLRRELLPFGIDAVSVAPGPVKTPIWAKARERTEVFAGTRYAFILDKLDAYIAHTEQSAIPTSEVASSIFAAATSHRPPTFRLLTSKNWLINLVRRLPARTLDKLVWRNIDGARRY